MNAVEDIKSSLSIEDVIGEYVQLKRTGRNWKGLSPFTNEKTPSFTVSPEKQIWHDFSSNKGGDVFSFIMEVEGLDFKGALELLARKAGIDLAQYQSSRQSSIDKERLYQLLDTAAKFYQVQLLSSKTALKYISGTRGYNKQTIIEWRLGYAPNNGNALVNYAKGKGYSNRELKLVGLSSLNFQSARDMFRERIMIPLQDAQGRVIGFTARLLNNDPTLPKYINTPKTVLYDKSRHIFGLHMAKESIRKTSYVVLVEGNLDVITSHQAGVYQTVATAGTALTEHHLKSLSHITSDIRLCFDADKAGLSATERAIPVASRVGVSLSIIEIPNSKDPDELIKKDLSLWKEIINKNVYAIDWLMERYKTLLDIKTAPGKRQYSDVLLPVVKSLDDDVERDHYMQNIADTLEISKEALTQKFLKTQAINQPFLPKKNKYQQVKVDILSLERRRLSDKFACLMLKKPTLRDLLDIISTDMLDGDGAKRLIAILKDHRDWYELKASDQRLSNLEDYVKIEEVLYEELYLGLELNELYDEALRLQTKLIEAYVKTNKNRIAKLLVLTDIETTHKLLEEVKEYDQLLRQVKGMIAYGEG